MRDHNEYGCYGELDHTHNGMCDPESVTIAEEEAAPALIQATIDYEVAIDDLHDAEYLLTEAGKRFSLRAAMRAGWAQRVDAAHRAKLDAGIRFWHEVDAVGMVNLFDGWDRTDDEKLADVELIGKIGARLHGEKDPNYMQEAPLAIRAGRKAVAA